MCGSRQETDHAPLLLSAAECARDLVSRALLWADTRRDAIEVLPRLFTALLPWLSEPHQQAPHLVQCQCTQCKQPQQIYLGTQ